MKKFIVIILVIVLGMNLNFTRSLPVKAETEEEKIDDLRRQIEELERQASQYRSSIASERAKANSLKRDIAILQGEIKQIETQIAITSKKIDKTKVEIVTTEEQIFDILDSIQEKRETLTRLLLFINQQDKENLIATLIKNRDLSDFFRQTQYVSNVSNQILTLTDGLRVERDALENNKEQLIVREEDLLELNDEHDQRRRSLSGATQNKNTLLKQTNGQEAQYQKMLADIEKKKAAFFQELKNLESSAILGGNFIVHVKATNLPPKGTRLFQWPEDGYRLTQGYGMTTYARRGAYGGSPHNGIDMASGFGSDIKSVGDGEILANGQNNGFGNWVAVKHVNDLVSVYGHMSSFAPLKVGTQVKMGQVIGYEGSTGNSTGSHLHLSMYREFFTYIKNDQLYFNYFEGSINPLDYL
ncbi:MAG: peptidoglycan DD-metalloendopeptidase family protein [Candidatus Yanofskybacteria bacterium]|nr:peptidoglycan DD-metalloendopeptidase family protein [Candidatus Yanofskybacteria bacterium]